MSSCRWLGSGIGLYASGSILWALTLLQVAATVATALIAYGTRNVAGDQMMDIKTNTD